MKPILIITKKEKFLLPFKEQQEKFDCKIIFSTWENIVVPQQDPKRVFVLENEEMKDLLSFSVVYARSVGKHEEKQYLACDYIRGKIPVVDSSLSSHSRHDSKAFRYHLLAKRDLPIIPFSYGSWDFIAGQKQSFSYPLVVKKSIGSQGKNVFLVDSQNELKKLSRRFRKKEVDGSYFLAQKYIENDGDYRLLIVGEKCLGTIKRTRQEKDEFRNNVSLGGKAEIAKLPAETVKMAIKSASVCGLDIAGVDLVRGREGNFFILEINSAPQFSGFEKATGINVGEEIIKYLIQRARSDK